LIAVETRVFLAASRDFQSAELADEANSQAAMCFCMNTLSGSFV
jgi:hypothetical protein